MRKHSIRWRAPSERCFFITAASSFTICCSLSVMFMFQAAFHYAFGWLLVLEDSFCASSRPSNLECHLHRQIHSAPTLYSEAIAHSRQNMLRRGYVYFLLSRNLPGSDLKRVSDGCLRLHLRNFWNFSVARIISTELKTSRSSLCVHVL